MERNFLKQSISISHIGKGRFWFAVVTGIIGALVLSYFFNYSREILRLMTQFGDLLVLSEEEYYWSDFFFSTLATLLGFGLTVLIWFSGKRSRRGRYRSRFVVTNGLFLLLLLLFCLSRFGYILNFSLFISRGYDGHLDLLAEFSSLGVLLIIYVFLNFWSSIRFLYKTKYAFFLSVILIGFISFFINKTTAIDRNIVNNYYFSGLQNRFDYINQEIEKATDKGVLFSDSTRIILRKKYSERTVHMVRKLKSDFQSSKAITLDWLVIQKILIHNLNFPELDFSRSNAQRWPYPTASELRKQWCLQEANSIERQLLFEILQEEIQLLNKPQFGHEYHEKQWTPYEMEMDMRRRVLVRDMEQVLEGFLQLREEIAPC
ncbi:hypothetical protein PEDI_35550 [Persicobacter diffluens]|uniref:Uncharacterized protein n=2 Tax=Persicobacter diffluens TaxID=981 RepID=A0AAN4W1Q5_9BACT|nr:hypothetical protein PEDI_35550 [Persicobacter diffluens]